MSINFREISSPAVLSAERRRIGRALRDNERTEWFIDGVMQTVNLTMKVRTKIATEFLKTKVVYNISRPVTKVLSSVSGVSPLTGRRRTRYFTRISNRSRSGEYPKADTTLLMKSIFAEVREAEPNVYDGYVGTPVEYAVPLEMTMNRSFLKRTLIEEKPRIIRILTGPVRSSDVIDD